MVEFGEEVSRIVQEVTDDKSLSKHERKALQIQHAGSISRQAKLVKLADKLDNLSGLQHSVPVSWSVARTQAYFGWASEVVRSATESIVPFFLSLALSLERASFKSYTSGLSYYNSIPLSLVSSSGPSRARTRP